MKKLILSIIIFLLVNSFVTAQNVIQDINFQGTQWNGTKPPDPQIAVGSDKIILIINNKIEIYNKSGSNLSSSTLSDWFSTVSPPGNPYDPRVVFDNLSNRWIVYALSRVSGGYSPSNYLIAVSQSDNPSSSWYYYKFDAKQDNGTNTNNHADYTGLGYDAEAVYITSNQIYDYGTFGFQYSKIKAIKKSDLYSGTSNPVNHDFFGMHNDDGNSAECIQPVKQFGPSDKFYLVNSSVGYSSDFISIWSITNPFGNTPTITLEQTVNVGSYDPPDDAEQKNSSIRIATNNDSRISDCIYRDGYIYGSFQVKNAWNNGSGIKYFKIDVSNYSLVFNDVIQQSNLWYYYPQLFPDAYGNLVIIFNKSGTNDYVGVAWTYRIANQSTIGPIEWLKQGEGVYNNPNNGINRWGDYNGICFDPSNEKEIWIYGEYAKSDNTWGSWAGGYKFNVSVTVTFTNKNSNTNLGGSFLVNNSVPVNSGQGTLLFEGDNHTKTNNERFANWNNSGVNYKNINWNDNVTEHFLEHDFTANFGNQQYQDANFKDLNYVKIDIKLENYSISGLGAGKFQDPWYVLSDGSQPGNYWKDFNSYYEPTGKEGASEKGVFLNQDYNVPGQPYYSVQAEVSQSIPMGGKYGTRPFYFNRWGGSGVQFEHSGNATTGVVFTSANATATAVMKGHLLSDNSDVFGNNGQQHLVRDYNGYYHLFYVSMGKIWHTKSLTTNFDGAWSQEQVVPMEASFDTPISISVDAANVPGPDSIAIAYTDGYSLGYTTINAATNALISTRYVQTNIEYGYGAFVKPVVAYTKKELMVIYRASASGGLYCSLKYKFYDNDPWIYSENNLLPHTGFTSSYPTIAVTKTGYSGDIFHIAFQEGNLRPSIMYGQLPEGANLSFNPYPISETSGFTFNFSPSISLFYLGNNVYKPLVSWTASNSGTLNKNDSQQGNQIPEPRMICRPQNDNGAWGDVFSSGQSVNFSANNSVIRTNTRTSVIAWSQSGGTESKWVRRENSTYSGATCLEPAGLIPNISTGSDLTNIKAVSSDATTMPAVLFPAVTSFNGTPICSGNQKVMLPYTLTYSRSGVILKNGIEFVFNTGDIINSDTVVKFKEAPDTIIYNSPEELNGSLITEPFHLDQNSSLLFTNYYYVINKEAADSLLSVIDAVSFRVELVNSSTNQVAGTFDNITFSKENLDDYENVSYEIDCSGISEGEYFLRIVTSQIGDASYSLINTQNDASNMAKKSYNKVAYSGEEIPLKYDLSQNYPNPFNPATTINYQLPQNGYVTLKIYDILGSEVSTLVNEQKNQGRYQINFDASHLASGVYIYQLRVNDYVSARKMLLLK